MTEHSGEPSNISADRTVDRRYGILRERYGHRNARSNGYRLHAYFLREQEMVLAALQRHTGTIVDIACGSGLMVQPLDDELTPVFGIDFNAQACQSAYSNGLAVVRGDAFALPFGDACIRQVVSCQFFNQQKPEQVERFVRETSRVLTPGGQAVLVWRNGKAWIHRVAHTLFTLLDRLRRRPDFPNFNHDHSDLRRYAQSYGLEVERITLSFPLLRWQTSRLDDIAATMFGASYFLILTKPMLGRVTPPDHPHFANDAS